MPATSGPSSPRKWRDLLSNRLLLGAVAFPALVFAAIPTGLVAFIEARDLDPNQLGQIQQYIATSRTSPKLAAQAFIVTNFMAYFLLIPAMVPMAIATQSVIGEKVARSLEPQLATPLEVCELLAGKTIAAALPAVHRHLAGLHLLWLRQRPDRRPAVDALRVQRRVARRHAHAGAAHLPPQRAARDIVSAAASTTHGPPSRSAASW